MSLPVPQVNQAYCDVSALEGGLINLDMGHFTTSMSPGSVITAPSLCFLFQHSTNRKKFLFDLGIRKGWEKFPQHLVELIKKNFPVSIPQDVVESLAKGGITPSNIDTVCLSHIHFDHVGDTSQFPESKFVVGQGTETMIGLHPEDPHADPIIVSELPTTRTEFLSGSSNWQPLGVFPRAIDFYGDGSLYIVDAPGHITGHINVLARTSADGAWIYLAGDSAHHWDLVTGKGQIKVHEGKGFFGCAYAHREASEQHFERLRALCATPRVRVLLAHDDPWYKVNKGGSAFWPGNITSL